MYDFHLKASKSSKDLKLGRLRILCVSVIHGSLFLPAIHSSRNYVAVYKIGFWCKDSREGLKEERVHATIRQKADSRTCDL